jgi:hypothetical protein
VLVDKERTGVGIHRVILVAMVLSGNSIESKVVKGIEVGFCQIMIYIIWEIRGAERRGFRMVNHNNRKMILLEIC